MATDPPLTPLPPRLATSTAYLLTRATRTAARLAQQHFGGEELRFPHYVVLCWVEHLGPCTQRALAAAMSTDPSDLVTVLRAVDEAGLLERATDPADRRRHVLRLTEAGSAWLRERQARADTYEAEFCASLGDQGEALRQSLTQILCA
ncbi:MAG: MarR family transcriptional regulator [Actinomycetia bacterium]|nr:MarR family transcriptional regulator [Actinomycetes bacterium]